MEIKLIDQAPPSASANSALAQIIKRGYAAKYRSQPGKLTGGKFNCPTWATVPSTASTWAPSPPACSRARREVRLARQRPVGNTVPACYQAWGCVAIATSRDRRHRTLRPIVTGLPRKTATPAHHPRRRKPGRGGATTSSGHPSSPESRRFAPHITAPTA